MTVIIVPTFLLWILIALFVVNGIASAYQWYLRRKLAKKETP